MSLVHGLGQRARCERNEVVVDAFQGTNGTGVGWGGGGYGRG